MLRKTTSLPVQKSEPLWVRVLELCIEASKALAWPLLVLIGLVVFYSPLQDIANQLVRRLEDANKVSIAGISWEIEAKVREVSSPELAKQVGSLSTSALEQLLKTDSSGVVVLLGSRGDIADIEPDSLERRVKNSVTYLGLPRAGLQGLEELESKGFIEFLQPFGAFLSKLQIQPLDRKESDSVYDWYSVPNNSPQLNEFRAQNYRLTEKGLKAKTAIVKVVSSLLSQGAR